MQRPLPFGEIVIQLVFVDVFSMFILPIHACMQPFIPSLFNHCVIYTSQELCVSAVQLKQGFLLKTEILL